MRKFDIEKKEIFSLLRILKKGKSFMTEKKRQKIYSFY